MIYEHYRVPGAHGAVLDYSDLFSVVSLLHGDDVQDFDTRWDHALLSAKELLKDRILERLYKMRIRESMQFQTVLAMYEQEILQDRSRQNYQKLNTVVRRHKDQLISSRNFKVRNERVETPSKGSAPRGSSSSGGENQKACRNYLQGNCTNPLRDCWHPPVCQNYKSELGRKFRGKCEFGHTEVERQPSKKPKKSGGKGSGALLKKLKQMGCEFQDKEPPKSRSTLHNSWDQSAVCASQRYTSLFKKTGKKGSIAVGSSEV